MTSDLFDAGRTRGKSPSLISGKRAILTVPARPPDGEGLRKATVPTTIIPVIPPGSQNVAAGGTFDYERTGDYRVVAIYVDVPEDVTATFEVNRSPIVAVTDGLGLVGRLEVGSLDGAAFLTADQVRLFGTNDHASESRDVRGFLVVIVG